MLVFCWSARHQKLCWRPAVAADESLSLRLAEAVGHFAREQMAVQATVASVDVHPESIVVTLRGVTSVAEQNYAQDKQASERLQMLYDKLFDAARAQIEAAVAELVGRPVRRSKMSIDPVSGDCIILFTLCHPPAEAARSFKPAAT